MADDYLARDGLVSGSIHDSRVHHIIIIVHNQLTQTVLNVILVEKRPNKHLYIPSIYVS